MFYILRWCFYEELDAQVLGFAFVKIIQLLLNVACCKNCFTAIGGICSAYPHLITAQIKLGA
ncbi:MAG TPA: hypothetical protein DCM62_08920 [Bacteroidales bacterium]|nr:hypothetical protein [Bacteroidales bacterium]